MALDADSPTDRLPVTVTPPAEPLGFWASYRAARRNLIELIPEAAYREPVLSGGRGAGWIMVQDPVWLEHILKTREPDYPKSDVTIRILRPREGDSLFTSEGREWRFQHRAMTPVFQHRMLRALAPVMTEAAEAAAERMRRAARADPVVDVYPEMVAATADVITDTALSGRESLDREGLTRGVTTFVEGVGRVSLLDILGAPNWIPRPAKLLDRNGPAMDRLMDGVIAARLARGPGEAPDLLDMLIAAEDPEDGRRMDRVELRNNLLAFIVAGHETTALALAWALYLLAFDPSVQARARAEAAIRGRGAGAEQLAAMPLVRRVIEEALRLYPPAGFLTRTARAEDEIAGRPVRPGATVILPVYALHRHRLLWERPDAFDPDRFSPERSQGRSRYAFLPFGAGPRICIGMGFAMMEAQIILATLLTRFEIAPEPGREPRPRMLLTLRPAGGMPLRLRPL